MNVTVLQIYVAPTWTDFLMSPWKRMTPAWLKRARALNERYAKVRGYNYRFVQEVSTNTHGKYVQRLHIVRALLQPLGPRDVILFLDNDAIVFNYNVRVESFLAGALSAAPDFVTAGYGGATNGTGHHIQPRTPSGGHCGVNAGVYILRGTAWSRRLLSAWIALDAPGRRRSERIAPNGDDQMLLAHLVQHHQRLLPTLHQHARFVTPPELLNMGGGGNSRFIIHLWGGLKAHISKVLDDVDHGRRPRLLVQMKDRKLRTRRHAKQRKQGSSRVGRRSTPTGTEPTKIP